MSTLNFLRLFITISTASFVMPQQALAKEITLEVSNIDVTRGGNLMVFIFGKDGFPKKHAKAILQQVQHADTETKRFSFTVTDTQFAVKVLHDEDENGKVTKNWTGIYPAEGLGFTNKQRVRTFGPPKWRKSKVDRDTVSAPIKISMVYPKNRKSKGGGE